MEKKRLFFGLETEVPWPEVLPEGRKIQLEHAHITLVFLGNVEYESLKKEMDHFPKPNFSLSPVGFFDVILFLPKKRPNVVAWHAHFLTFPEEIKTYQKQLSSWLSSLHLIEEDTREYLPHMTVCRKPFDEKKWKNSFSELPFFTKGIHLYESKGNMQYEKIWTYDLEKALVEISHLADLAFQLQATSFDQLALHAQIALSFSHPPFLKYVQEAKKLNSFNEVVAFLNETLRQADAEEGMPFKAISYSGKVEEKKNGMITWEMIVDV